MGNIILGVILIVVSIFGITYWWWDILVILRGLIPIVLFIVGIVAVIAGLEILRDRPRVNADKEGEVE